MNAVAIAQIAPLAETLSRTGDGQHLISLDSAWAESEGSVVRTARLLQQPYGTTLRKLTAPEAKLLAPDDPRVMAHAIAMAELENGREPPKAGRDEAMRVIYERNAVRDLQSGRNEDKAVANLVVVAQHEIVRDITLLQARQQQQAVPAKTSTRREGLSIV